MPTISQFYEAALLRQRDFPSERTGQALMNTLHEYNQPLWYKVMEEGIDPFYDNGLLDDFYNFIDDNWEGG